MKNQGLNETVVSSSRIPRISGNLSIHKFSRSDCFQNSPLKSSSTRLSLNIHLLNSTKPRAPSFVITSKNNSLCSSQKSSKERLDIKEPLKTVKSTIKKFELNNRSVNQSFFKFPRNRWEEIKIPISPNEALNKFSDSIPSWEHEELKGYPEIYYIGKNFKPKEPEFDDEDGDYKILIKDHIAFRFEIVGIIGKGSFGQVVEVFDHKEKKSIAMKIIKNKSKFNSQAKVEVEILEFIKNFDLEKTSNIIEIQGSFIFRKHMVKHK